MFGFDTQKNSISILLLTILFLVIFEVCIQILGIWSIMDYINKFLLSM